MHIDKYNWEEGLDIAALVALGALKRTQGTGRRAVPVCQPLTTVIIARALARPRP